MPLRFKKSRCTGCKLCQLACSANHEKVFNPEKARIKINHEYQEDRVNVSSRYCIYCKECEEACPEGAISNNGNNMVVNWDKCIGCATCVTTCPTKIIFLNENQKSVICDLCSGSPMCVKWCPKDAISFFTKKKKRAS